MNNSGVNKVKKKNYHLLKKKQNGATAEIIVRLLVREASHSSGGATKMALLLIKLRHKEAINPSKIIFEIDLLCSTSQILNNDRCLT